MIFLFRTAWCVGSLVAVATAGSIAAENSAVEVNRVEPINASPLIGAPTYDAEPSAAQLPDGSHWIVWQTYDAGSEQIIGRVVRDARRERPVEVSAKGIVCHPKIVARDAGNADVVWSAFEHGRWRVKSRALRAHQWGPVSTLSVDAEDAIQPALTAAGPDGLCVAWSVRRAGRFRIVARLFQQGTWQEARELSDEAADGFRPAIAVTNGGDVWIAWDTYANGEYTVQARQLRPELAGIEQVATPGVKTLNPVLHATKFGMAAAWVKVVDVVGGDGVIDQFHTLQVALRSASGWTMMRDAEGRDELAELHHGFLAKMDPKPVWSTGYLGRRRQPLLKSDGDNLWLLWERKADHLASTAAARGELLGRRYDGAWHPTVRLHAGLLEYHLASAGRARDGRLPVIASNLPSERRRIWEVQSAALDSSDRVAVEPWKGWKPIALPLRPRAAARHEVRVDGKAYRLFWVDTHVHSNLTADAEGEPDEIIHYARDKSHLDAVVIQENDLVYDVPLTESEYAMGSFFARSYYRRNGFLVLPGYEWTQIIPVGGADPARPLFWQATTRNHRTVVYPLTGGPLLRYTEVGNDINRLYAAVARHGGIVHAQHPTFELTGHPVEVAVEATAGWGIYFLNTARIHRALQEGYRPGFVGTTDGHRRTPGLSGGVTGVFAEELGDRALLDAYRARRVFATTGTRFALESWVNDTFMGQEKILAAGETARLTVRVRSPVPVRRVVLIGDGVELRSYPGDGRSEMEIRHEVGSLSTGGHWFYWRIETDGSNAEYPGNLALAEGNLGWSSPVWVTQR